MGKVKKLLVLLTLAAGLIGFSTGAFAQSYYDPCSSCLKKDDTVGTVGPGPAGGSCGSFDYETTGTYQAGTRGTGNYRTIFRVCNCLEPETNFAVGRKIGIKMTILVDGLAGQRGAYWSQPASTDVQFGMYRSENDACMATAYTRNFGAGTWWKTDSEGKATTEVTSLAGGTACVVPTANQATLLVTDPVNGYEITETDDLNNLSRWWIDIPEIRIDPNVLHNGETISVKMEILDQSSRGTICECSTPVDVAKVSTYTPIFRTLTVASSDPDSGVSITVNPSDNSGQGSGTTPFTRTYNDNTPITLTAPSRAGDRSFSSWTGCTSTSGATCNVTMDSAKAVTANFVPGHSLPWLLLLFGD